MNLFEFNNSDIAFLPKTYNEYFPTFIERIFRNYIKTLESLADNEHTYEIAALKGKVPYVKELSKEITNSVKEYYQGNVRVCYNILDSIISKEKELFETLVTFPKERDLFNRMHPRGLFRIRVIKNSRSKPDRNDLFHIPYEHRHNASTGRYSIPGLPCLYLASSLYLAKKELALT